MRTRLCSNCGWNSCCTPASTRSSETRSRCRGGGPREVEQPRDALAESGALAEDVAGPLARGLIDVAQVEDQLGRAVDGRQRVLNAMRHAGTKLADRCKALAALVLDAGPLGLEGLVGLLQLADVPEHAEQGDDECDSEAKFLKRLALQDQFLVHQHFRLGVEQRLLLALQEVNRDALMGVHMGHVHGRGLDRLRGTLALQRIEDLRLGLRHLSDLIPEIAQAVDGGRGAFLAAQHRRVSRGIASALAGDVVRPKNIVSRRVQVGQVSPELIR